MTRTARASFPRAIMRDRSLSKSGMDKSLRKAGAGAHNWGFDIAASSTFEALDDDSIHDDIVTPASPASSIGPRHRRESVSTTTSAASDGNVSDKEQAVAFRAKGLKNKKLDLGSIARTSSAVHSPVSPK